MNQLTKIELIRFEQEIEKHYLLGEYIDEVL